MHFKAPGDRFRLVDFFAFSPCDSLRSNRASAFAPASSSFRADANTVEVRTGDTTCRTAACASGAHVVGTDHSRPDPAMGTNYQVSLTVGEPERHNPLTATD